MWSEVLLVARLILGSTFLISGLGKLFSSTPFVEGIMDYQLLSRRQAELVAPVLPFVEVALAVLCITGVALPVASILLLLLLFTTGIVINLLRGRRFDCHCFGSTPTLIGPAIVVRNALLIGIATFTTVQSRALLSPAATVMHWRVDLQTLAHLDTIAPLVATVLLSLSALFLISEIDVVLGSTMAGKGER